jgi:hypothetical protein
MMRPSTTFEGRFDQIGREKGERDRHVDLADSCIFRTTVHTSHLSEADTSGILGHLRGGTSSMPEKLRRSNSAYAAACGK